MPYPGKGGMHLVIILLADGIELVVVATGATQRHSQESSAGGVDHFIDGVGPYLRLLILVLIIYAVEGPGHKE